MQCVTWDSTHIYLETLKLRGNYTSNTWKRGIARFKRATQTTRNVEINIFPMFLWQLLWLDSVRFFTKICVWHEIWIFEILFFLFLFFYVKDNYYFYQLLLLLLFVLSCLFNSLCPPWRTSILRWKNARWEQSVLICSTREARRKCSSHNNIMRRHADIHNVYR